ncbi:MAG5150 family histidine triad lipoprotein [Mycoplasma simbae]|uniref:MAG5150 family histidine triad lipoprotein n=1 Tax=Mycoplasma simbae TaxID=36744 RepID=UPI0004985932|nr:hypothetical protein [Mycoplasma simbae]
MKFRLYLGTVGTIVPFALAVASCNNDSKTPQKEENKLTGDNKTINDLWAKFNAQLDIIKNGFGQKDAQFYSINTNFAKFAKDFEAINHDNEGTVFNLIKKVTNLSHSGAYQLNQQDYESWDQDSINIYNNWLASKEGSKLFLASRSIIDDAKIQISSALRRLNAKNNSNAFVTFDYYLKEQGNKQYKDEEINRLVKQVELFIDDYIYNDVKYQSDLADSLDNEHNHSGDLHSHSHSHALVNITLNSIRQNQDFIKRFEKVLALKEKIATLSNIQKRDYYLNEFYSHINLDLAAIKEQMQKASDELINWRTQSTKLLEILNQIKLVINPQ